MAKSPKTTGPGPDIDRIVALEAGGGTTPDAETQADQWHAKAMRAQTRKERKDHHAARESYRSRLFRLMVCWLFAVIFLVFLSGTKYPIGRVPTGEIWDWVAAFTLSDEVLLALVAGASVNVVGLFVIVAKNLFDRKD